MGECFFWYRPTRVVPDQRPLNGCVCVCVYTHTYIQIYITPNNHENKSEARYGDKKTKTKTTDLHTHTPVQRPPSYIYFRFVMNHYIRSWMEREYLVVKFASLAGGVSSGHRRRVVTRLFWRAAVISLRSIKLTIWRRRRTLHHNNQTYDRICTQWLFLLNVLGHLLVFISDLAVPLF